MKKTAFALAAATVAVPSLAPAHFLLNYTEQTMIAAPGDVPVKLIFWHPFDNGHVMDLVEPQEFYAVHRGEKIDLKPTLRATTFRSPENEGTAFLGSVPVRRSGDYVLVTVPEPYYEESEDAFIQQFAKVILNRNQLPTDWTRPVGLPTEILPLTKPYNVLAGGTFTGQVLSDGQPAGGVEIEIEYMAAVPRIDAAGSAAPVAGPVPGGALVTVSDENGYFTFGVPRAGHWGFAALGSGPDTAHQGKALSQDAVLWIRAWDLQ